MVSKFSLVDYIVVAMVVAIKSKLILGDSNTCNSKFFPFIKFQEYTLLIMGVFHE